MTETLTRFSEQLTTEQIEQRVQEMAVTQAHKAVELAGIHGWTEALANYSEPLLIGPASGYSPLELEEAGSPWSADEIDKCYSEARNDGFAIGTLNRITQDLKHNPGAVRQIKQRYVEDITKLHNWLPGDESSLKKASDVLIETFCQLPASSPAAAEVWHLLRDVSSNTPDDKKEIIMDTKRSVLRDHLAESYYVEKNDHRSDRLRSAALALGVEKIGYQDPAPASKTKPTHKEEATQEAQSIPVPAPQRPEPELETKRPRGPQIIAHKRGSKITFVAVAGAVAGAVAPGGAAHAASVHMELASDASIISSPQDKAAVTNGLLEQIPITSVDIAPAPSQAATPASTVHPKATNYSPKSSSDVIPITTVNINLSATNPDNSPPANSAPVESVPLVGVGPSVTKIAKQVEADPGLPAPKPVSPHELPAQISTLAANAPLDNGHALAKSTQVYVHAKLGLPGHPSVATGNGTVASVVADHLAPSGNQPSDPGLYTEGTELANLLANHPDQVRQEAGDPVIHTLTQDVQTAAATLPDAASSVATQFDIASADNASAYTPDQQSLLAAAVSVADSAAGTASSAPSGGATPNASTSNQTSTPTSPEQQTSAAPSPAAQNNSTESPANHPKPAAPGGHNHASHEHGDPSHQALNHMEQMGSKWQNRAIAMRFFINHGFTPAQAAGLVGNFSVEAAGPELNPSIPQYGGGPGRGIVQWGSFDPQYDRFGYNGQSNTLTWFAKQIGQPWDSLDTQLKFVVWELNHTQTAAKQQLLAANNVAEATSAVMNYYERPAARIVGPRLHWARQTLGVYQHLTRQQQHQQKSAEHNVSALFTTAGELPNAQQMIRRAHYLASLSPGELHGICGGKSGCYEMCAALAADTWGHQAAGYGSAAIEWNAMQGKGEAHPGSRHVPVGALLFYNTGKPHGHVAVYLGHDMILSNDVHDTYSGEGGAYIVPAEDMEGADWNLQYLGWSLPDYSTPLVSGWHDSPPAGGHEHQSGGGDNQGGDNGPGNGQGNGNGNGNSGNNGGAESQPPASSNPQNNPPGQSQTPTTPSTPSSAPTSPETPPSNGQPSGPDQNQPTTVPLTGGNSGSASPETSASPQASDNGQGNQGTPPGQASDNLVPLAPIS